MMKHHWTNSLKALGLGLIALAGTASAQSQSKEILVPVDPVQELQDHGRMLFKFVDENNDGQISQKEAIDAGNLVVGGFFFRTDANGDGVVSQEEARQAHDSFMAQKPMLRFLIGRAKYAKATQNPGSPGTQDPFNVLLSLVDANNDKQLQANEVRQAIQGTIQGLFASADTNRDGLMSPTEVNAAIVGAVRGAEQAAFQAADINGDGQISKEEFIKAMADPANAAFVILDANNDGQLSPQELQSAARLVQNQIQKTILPEAPNSLRNLLRTGQKPDQVAPVPNISVPARPNQATTPAPVPVAPTPR